MTVSSASFPLRLSCYELCLFGWLAILKWEELPVGWLGLPLQSLVGYQSNLLGIPFHSLADSPLHSLARTLDPQHHYSDCPLWDRQLQLLEKVLHYFVTQPRKELRNRSCRVHRID